MILLQNGKGKFYVNVKSGNDFMDEVGRIKTLPKGKYAWNGDKRRWEVAYDQYWRLREIFNNGRIEYVTDREVIESMLSKVFIHFHREFKNQIGITSITHELPSWLVSDKYRVIEDSQIKKIIQWCGERDIGYHVEDGIYDFIKSKHDPDLMTYECPRFLGELYPFQVEGAIFLLNTKRAILADMTGLGKCPQALAAIAKLVEDKEIKRTIVFCPNTIKRQWESETKKFTDLIPLVISGTKKKREKQYKEAHEAGAHIVIINYELLLRDLQQIKLLRADVVVADEVSAIKNQNAKKTKAIKELVSKYKFALSATPMENSPVELFSICQWVDPEIFGNWWQFFNKHVVKDYWGGIARYKDIEVIGRKLKGVMLRRKKEEVADQLPDIVPQVRMIELDKTTRFVYDAICGKLVSQIDEAKSLMKSDVEGSSSDYKSASGNALALFTLLKQVCDDARLLETSKSEFAEGFVRLFDTGKVKSNKLDEIKTVVEEVMRNEEKVVIFTEYKRMIPLLKEKLKGMSTIVEISGGVKEEQRHKNREQFWNDKATKILISTDAGKYGQNLQCASYLISVDAPWNPATFEQRIGRIYRLGSTVQSVTVISFITRGTVEERIMEILEKKLDLFEQIIDGKSIEHIKLNMSTMRQLVTAPDFDGIF